MSLKTRLITPAFQFGSLASRVAPRMLTRGIEVVGGKVIPRFSTEQRAMVARHQQRLAGGTLSPQELDQRVEDAFASYVRYWIDMMRLDGASTEEVEAGIRPYDASIVDRALEKGNGAIMAMPHIGAWDYGGTWVAHRWGLTTVAERVDPPELFDWFVERRTRNKMRVLAHDDPNTTAELIATLRRNDVVGLLCDRDLMGGGIEVTMFGEKTTVPAGPALMSLRTGAPIIPNVAYQRDGYIEGVIKPAIEYERTGKLRDDIAALCQLVATALEDMIRAAPTQWHVLQPVWPSDPGYDRMRQ